MLKGAIADTEVDLKRLSDANERRIEELSRTCKDLESWFERVELRIKLLESKKID